MSKDKDKKDPRVHYGPPPETWLWDLYPLAEKAWGNILGFDDGSGDGNFIDMRMWLRPRPMSNYPPPVYRPANAPLPPVGYGNGGVRRCYIPQADDLEIVRRLWPQRDASNPPWPRMEAELIAAGKSRDDLVKMNAPTLLLLLAQTRSGAAQAGTAESGSIQPTSKNDRSPKTLGELLRRIEASEAAYRQNNAKAKAHEREGGADALWWRMQTEVLRFQPDPLEWPGVDVLEAICQAKFGSGLKVENLRRIRGELITGRGLIPAAVDSMTIQQVTTELQRGRQPGDSGNKKLVWSIVLISALWVVVVAGLECVVGWCAWKWGAGENLWQKIINFWPLFGAVFVVCAFIYPFLLGRERLQLLKFWKGDDK